MHSIVMSCGANVPFVDDQVFFGPTAKYADEKMAIVPDFIANSGMARVFAYLMQPNADLSDKGIFSDVSNTIKEAMQQVKATNNEPVSLSTTALTAALNKLM